jgi:Ca2+:H+ antiporter
MGLWPWLVPVFSVALVGGAIVAGVGLWLAALCGVGLLGSVIAAVHHAEVVAIESASPSGRWFSPSP